MFLRPALCVDLAVNAALVGRLAFALARPDLPQFDGNGMVARAAAYPVAALEYVTFIRPSRELRTAYTGSPTCASASPARPSRRACSPG